MSPLVAIKIDVDTHDGMRVGVPRLLAVLARHRMRASVFLALGPDRSGLAMVQLLRSPRFLAKMLATRAGALYGWRTALSGTLLPARPVASAFPALVRALADDGHELGVHAWDHRAWQDGLPDFSAERIERHFSRAWSAFQELTGRPPEAIAAPSWTTTPLSLALQDRLPLRYASDLRGGPPCRLATCLGTMRLPQLPATGACLEELLAGGLRDPAALEERLVSELAQARSPLRVVTLHAEVEGGPYCELLDRLLPRLRGLGELVTLGESLGRLGELPLRAWCLRRLPGRSFPVSSSRPLLAPPVAAARPRRG
jgi:undecaprenyl phosphate-alpha-L-ara4FN deformylase